MNDRNEQLAAGSRQSALFTGLVTATIVTIVVKLLTGMALLPLLIIAVLVFAIAGSLRLRVIRSSPRPM